MYLVAVVLGVIFFAVFYSTTHADTAGTFSITSGGDMTITGLNMSANFNFTNMAVYFGDYPDTSTAVVNISSGHSASWATTWGPSWFNCTFNGSDPVVQWGVPTVNFCAIGTEITGQGDGNYWLGLTSTNQNGGVQLSYYPVNVSGGGTVFSTIPPNTPSQILSLFPADGTGTASTTVVLSIHYYANSSDDLTNLGYTLWDASKGFTVVFDGIAASTTQNAVGIYAHTWVLTSGDTYKLTAYLTNNAGDALKSADSNTSGASSDGSAEFSVNTTFIPAAAGICPTTTTGALATSTCGVTNITGCFQNALTWAFCPTPAVMQMVAQDGAQIKTRPPVGYIFGTIGALQSLGGTTTPAFALTEDWPIMHYIFQPLTLALTGGIWFLLAIGLFHRARDLDV